MKTSCSHDCRVLSAGWPTYTSVSRAARQNLCAISARRLALDRVRATQDDKSRKSAGQQGELQSLLQLRSRRSARVSLTEFDSRSGFVSWNKGSPAVFCGTEVRIKWRLFSANPIIICTALQCGHPLLDPSRRTNLLLCRSPTVDWTQFRNC